MERTSTNSDSFTKGKKKKENYTSILASRKTSHVPGLFDYAWHLTLSSYCIYQFEHSSFSDFSSNEILDYNVRWNPFESTPTKLKCRFRVSNWHIKID